MLLVKLLAQADEQVVVLDRVRDGGELFRNLALIEEVRHFRPVVLVLRAEGIGQAARVVLELAYGLGIGGRLTALVAWVRLLVGVGVLTVDVSG